MKINPLFGQMSETVELVDKAAQAGDRWLFIAALVLLLSFAGIVIKWLVKSLEAKDALHSNERKALSDSVADIIRKSDAELEKAREQARIDRKEDRQEYLNSIHILNAEIRELAANIAAITQVLTSHDRDTRIETQWLGVPGPT